MAEYISVSDIKDSLTECPICTEQFDETTRIPRRMPCCVQSICQPCLETYIKGRQTLVCPICRHKHNLPDGVRSLPKEPLILKILDHLKVQKGFRMPCSDCPDNSRAIAQCDNCGILLCRKCLKAHVRNKVTKNHTTVKFKKMKDHPLETFRLRHCAEHNQPEQFFCHTCKAIICVSCTVVDHDKGKGHNVVSLEEAHQDKAAIINEILAKLDEKVHKLSQSVQELQKKRKIMQTSNQRAKEDINKIFDQIMQNLQERRSVLLSEVDKKSEEDQKLTEEVFESTNTLLTKIKATVEYTKKLRSKADKIEDLQIMASSTESLNIMLQESSQGVKFERSAVYFISALVQQLMSLVEIVGLVRRVNYTATTRPDYVPLHETYNSITFDPVEFTRAKSWDQKIALGGEIINCPYLEWDPSTASVDVNISGSVVTNVTRKPCSEDVGCRLQTFGRVLVSSPLLLKQGQKIRYDLKIAFTLKRGMPEKQDIFGTALTSSPVDATWDQSNEINVTVRTCPKHKSYLCFCICSNNKHVTDLPIVKYAEGSMYWLHLCILLDGNSNTIDVIDAAEAKPIKSVAHVVFEKPLWILTHLANSAFSDMTVEHVSGNRIDETQDMKQLLSNRRLRASSTFQSFRRRRSCSNLSLNADMEV